MPLDLGSDPHTGSSDEAGRLQVQFGADNPYLDLRRPGDPGGVGYRRLNTQFQLFDNGGTGIVIGFQALQPSGVEFDGLNEGPTVVRPAIGMFQEVGEGMAVHGFVGKDVQTGPQWSTDLDRNLQYGMAVQTLLPGVSKNPRQSVSFVLEALGRYRREMDAARTPLSAWEVVPGVHWRNADSWWMSGGVLVPVGAGRLEGGVLQITCGMQF
jgi:hypothetical protein